MRSKSIKGKTAAGIRLSISESMADGFQPTVAIVFLALEQEREATCTVFSEMGITVFGTSTGSNFTDGELESDCIVVLLLDIKPENFRLNFETAESGRTADFAETIARAGLAAFSRPSFLVVSGGITTDGDEIVEGIEKVCGKGVTIFGGLAADNLKMIRTYVFTNDRYSEKGLVALIFDEEKIGLSGMAIGGWRPMGMEHTITESEGNVLHKINDEPALEFITRYSGIKDLYETEGSNLVLSSNFQILLYREGKHPVMRTPMYANREDQSIVFAGSVPRGSKLRLCLLPGFEIIEASLRDFALYKNEQPDADALLMFSCAGRLMSLGPFVSDEINGIKKIWNAPMAGFFCFGEIGRVQQGDPEFHNMTCSLAILKEK